MLEEIKFTTEEMGHLSNLQERYKNVQDALGRTNVARIKLNQQFEDLDKAEDNLKNQFVETQVAERTFVESINKKYGDGNLNVDTGVFTPTAVEENSNKTL